MHKNSYQLIKNHFNKRSKDIGSIEFIIHEVTSRMMDRLNYIKLLPKRILDIGSGLNLGSKQLQHKFQKSQILKLDFAINMLKIHNRKLGFIEKVLNRNREYICANAINLPIANQSVDFVWSNLVLPYIEDIELYFKEIRRILAINGSFLISGLGVYSLRELRDIGLSTYNFPDMHVIGDILVKLGFTNPVTDVEYITLEYDNFDQLLKDVRTIGCGFAIEKPNKITKYNYRLLRDKFSQITKNGKLPLTLEVFYAHAWKDRVVADLPDGVSAV
ncbi:MAG: class I SAM-dependent methyltransferase, partial [Burkholderiales bacterium]|nr:class I SAM-dependent methyltransferase [Burkholderiales bacterium]